ncbi:hypothetical protein AB0L40_26710, partial [Patulibacter sp. NPDC049589]
DGAAELERQARRAEEAGEHRAAVVLWFRAGARRLRERRRVRADETTTATQVARAAGDDRVLALAVAHDRAAYGPGPVGPDASRGAREGWAAVLADRRPAGSEGPGPAGGTAGGGGTATTAGTPPGPGDLAGSSGDAGPAVGAGASGDSGPAVGAGASGDSDPHAPPRGPRPEDRA